MYIYISRLLVFLYLVIVAFYHNMLEAKNKTAQKLEIKKKVASCEV